ncbi:hypothetical protein Lser_V15G19704 [Lactuca serriola]
MASFKVTESHNVSILLDDPPMAHSEFKSMMFRLRECCIFSALTWNPIIYLDLINEFWSSASIRNERNGAQTIEATVKGRKIVITEQFIRDTLKLDEKDTYPTDIDLRFVDEYLENMGYEGIFPPTLKKLLPPYWRFLAHVFVNCISGRKGGADEISSRNIQAIIALAAGIDFNFSRFILEEMVTNLKKKAKDQFLLYPRFIQIFLNCLFPDLAKTGEILDMKAFGPNTISLMKKNQKGKIMFQEKYRLEKFGKFAELTDSSESHGSPEQTSIDHASSEYANISDDIIDVSDHGEETAAAQTVSVAEEHNFINVTVQSDFDGGSTEEFTEAEEGEENERVDLSGYDIDDIAEQFTGPEYTLSNEDLDDIFNDIDDDANPTPEIRKNVDNQEVEPLLLVQTVDSSIQIDTSSGILPLERVISTSEPIVSEAQTYLIFQPPMKRQRADVGVIFPGPTQTTETPLLTNTTSSSSMPIQEGPNSIHEVGGSSAGLSLSPPRPHHDVAFVRLAMHLAQDLSPTHSSRKKGISFEENIFGDDDASVPDLRKEISVLNQKNIELDIKVADLQTENIKLSNQVADHLKENAQKSKQITDLHTHFGLLTASYYDLKKTLEEEFGDKFKSSISEPKIYLPNQDAPVVPPPTKSTRVVNRFEKEPVQAPHIVELKRARQGKDVEKGQLLFEKNSDQNAPVNQPEITVTDIGENRFRDIYGDRSEIVS